MKKFLLLFLLTPVSLLFAQSPSKCGDITSSAKGHLVDSSAVQPRMKTDEKNSYLPGTTGELTLLSEDGNFRMTYSIGWVKIISASSDEITFEVIEKMGVMTINGVERNNFSTGARVQFNEVKFDTPHTVETLWPSGTVKETGQMLCDKKTGEWREYHENGKLRVSYNTDKNGEIEGIWKSYYASGVTETEGVYTHGKKSGYWTEYFENGEIRAQGYYSSGEKTGKWIETDSSGKKIKRKY